LISKGVLARVLVLAAIAMIAGTGLCLLDSDDAAGSDLCHSVVATAIVLLSGLSLIPTAYLLPASVPAYHHYPSDLPAPPPKA